MLILCDLRFPGCLRVAAPASVSDSWHFFGGQPFGRVQPRGACRWTGGPACTRRPLGLCGCAVRRVRPAVTLTGVGGSATVTLAGGVHGFPAALTSFIGRDGPLRELAGLLAEYRLVTVTGPGG